jgi:hypothetical protein
MVALSPIMPFNCFKMGAIILQGPHHSAEKSTNTGLSDFMISEKFDIAILFIRQINKFQPK